MHEQSNAAIESYGQRDDIKKRSVRRLGKRGIRAGRLKVIASSTRVWCAEEQTSDVQQVCVESIEEKWKSVGGWKKEDEGYGADDDDDDNEDDNEGDTGNEQSERDQQLDRLAKMTEQNESRFPTSDHNCEKKVVVVVFEE